MPRERIQHGTIFRLIEHPETEDHSAWTEQQPWPRDVPVDSNAKVRMEPSLDLSWTREDAIYGRPGFVQVSMEFTPEALTERIKGLEDGQTATISLFSENLNRAEINNMIRVLKRARDAAHGKDE